MGQKLKRLLSSFFQRSNNTSFSYLLLMMQKRRIKQIIRESHKSRVASCWFDCWVRSDYNASQLACEISRKNFNCKKSENKLVAHHSKAEDGGGREEKWSLRNACCYVKEYYFRWGLNALQPSACIRLDYLSETKANAQSFSKDIRDFFSYYVCTIHCILPSTHLSTSSPS
jgi:hypothetical protein